MPAQTFDPRIPYIITEYESGESFINQNGLYFDRYGNSYPTLPKTGNGYSAPYSDAAWSDTTGSFLVKPDGTTVSVAGASQREIVVTFDGSGTLLTVGDTHTYYTSPFSGTLQSWYLTTDSPASSLVLGVWKTSGLVVPTAANSITGGNDPTLVGQQIGSSTTLVGWSTAVTAGDIFGFSVNSVVLATKATLVIKLTAS